MCTNKPTGQRKQCQPKPRPKRRRIFLLLLLLLPPLSRDQNSSLDSISVFPLLTAASTSEEMAAAAAAVAQSLSTNLQKVHKPNLQTPKLQPPQSLKSYTLQNPSFSRISDSTFRRRRSLLQPIPATALPTAGFPGIRRGLHQLRKYPSEWSVKAIKAFAQAELQARKLKCPETGTDSLLLGVLIDGTSAAAKYLWENGITAFRTRDVIIKFLEDDDVFAVPGEFPPLTEDAQRAVDWAVDHKMKSGAGGEVTTIDMILGIWSDADSPGHKVLAAMGFNDEKAKELESRNSGPGMVEA
ncbi:ATP-dependent Clp protease ATP-binding subunit CLPT2, chloroplastic [Linum grandiflorum]